MEPLKFIVDSGKSRSNLDLLYVNRLENKRRLRCFHILEPQTYREGFNVKGIGSIDCTNYVL